MEHYRRQIYIDALHTLGLTGKEKNLFHTAIDVDTRRVKTIENQRNERVLVAISIVVVSIVCRIESDHLACVIRLTRLHAHPTPGLKDSDHR